MELLNITGLDFSEEATQLLASGRNVRIERIVSAGQSSPEDFWYDQEEAEYVVVLQGEAVLGFPDGRQILRAGDGWHLPAHQRHRVEFTSREPACIWLCIFYKED